MSNAITTLAVTSWHATIRTAVLASVAVLIVLLAFLWPSYTSKVKDLPIVVAGPTAAPAQLTQALSATGAFEITAGTDRAAAVTAIEKREAYGAIVTSRTGIEVLTASAASPVAAQALTGVSQKLAAQAAEQAKASGQAAPAVTTTDIVPFGEKDPRGSNLAVAGLPLAMGGMLGGVLVSLLVTGHKRRLGAVAAYAVVGGLALAAVLGPWLHVLTGSYLGAAVIGSASSRPRRSSSACTASSGSPASLSVPSSPSSSATRSRECRCPRSSCLGTGARSASSSSLAPPGRSCGWSPTSPMRR